MARADPLQAIDLEGALDRLAILTLHDLPRRRILLSVTQHDTSHRASSRRHLRGDGGFPLPSIALRRPGDRIGHIDPDGRGPHRGGALLIVWDTSSGKLPVTTAQRGRAP